MIDPTTRLSERDLDNLKTRTMYRMQGVRDGFIWRTDTLASKAYNVAHAALLECRTEDEVARVEQGLADGIKMLHEALNART